MKRLSVSSHVKTAPLMSCFDARAAPSSVPLLKSES
jgi:hypothetical protein